MSRNKALTVHESFASNLAFGDAILWDAYTPQEFQLFKEKLKQLFRDPETKHGAANKAMERRRQNIYRNTIAQRKYTNRNLLSGFILVTVAEGTTYTQARDATKFSVHLVVRTRKCMKEDDSSRCCMIFIDECGNVYQNWQHFIETNSLPAGIAFAPSRGVYTYSGNSLNMDSWDTPARSLSSKIATGADYAAGVGGMGAAAITLAAVCSVPVSAPILAGATVVALGAGAITSVRSSMRLLQRSRHEQTLSVTDSEARGCWLGVTSGALALSSVAATKTLSRLALAGKEVSLMHETVVNGMNVSTMLVSGTGVANGILDLILKYSEDDKVSALEVAQLGASLVIFTHSVYNFRLASTIITQTQDSKVNAYRRELSSRQRQMFDKMAKETVRIRGNSKGKIDLIRWINEVPDNQYLNDLYQSNKQLNQNNVRFAAGTEGNVVLNEEISVRPSDLRSDIKLNQGENILRGVSNPIPESHTSTSSQSMGQDIASMAFNSNTRTLLMYCKAAYNFGSGIIFSESKFQDCVRLILSKLDTEVTEYLIIKSRDFIQMYGRRIEGLIRTSVYIDQVLFDLFNQVNHIENLTVQKLEPAIHSVFERLLKFYENKSCDDVRAKRFKCKVCKGVYRVSPL